MCYIKAQPVPFAGLGSQEVKESQFPPACSAPVEEITQQFLDEITNDFTFLSELNYDSLDDADWFNEGCGDVFAATGAVPFARTEEEQAGQFDFEAATFPLLEPELTIPKLAAPSAADLLPWLDSLTASTAAVLESSPLKPVPECDDSAAAVKVEEEPPRYHLPSPQQSNTSATPSPTICGIPFVEQVARQLLPVSVPALAAPPKKPPKRKATDSPVGDEDDEVALKRSKNTEAARRSRARKTARLETLETDVSRLEQDKANLLVRLAVLENERNNASHREMTLAKRVAQLELQLAESHRAMVMGLGIQSRV
ncbi:hypothetical protein DFJ73DRAFT_785148 [Zopfochytrium polystomum]|nr:hypothetical protein DFJ73DRAFT_785148 [Zopfochytrium polystomum]